MAKPKGSSMIYKAPLDDMRFVLNEVLNVQKNVFALPDVPKVNDEELKGFLDLGAQTASDILLPINRSGDMEGCIYDPAAKTVKTPEGFKEAYQAFCEAGFPSFSCDPKYGGMGMPVVLNTAISEMICSGNLAWGMYPGLSHGAYNALHEYGSDELKNAYLPKLVSGEWLGTMCLTEPGAGTDLGLITTKAKKQTDGSFAIEGTKIFISAGEHDVGGGNICHLVLAKIDDPSTPKGIKGISLFLVPKFMPDAQGNPGERNAVECGGIEHKLGIHGNSTCVMNFNGAKGFLVGEEHKGMRAMFVMMNEARLAVGLQGLGLSEVAYQNAANYATEIRVQSAPVDQKDATSAKIIVHPEVRRELMTIKSQVEGARMLSYWTAMQVDVSQKHPDESVRRHAKDCLDFLTPIVKAHLTDNAEKNTSAGMQIFGGNGFIEEYGMAQFYRDARITRIYEGTNGIQALDLIGRKTLQQDLLWPYLKQLERDLKEAKRNGVSSEFTAPVEKAANKLRWATRKLKFKGFVGKFIKKDMGPTLRDAASIATDYLNLASLVAMGHMWVKMVDVAQQKLSQETVNKDFYEAKINTARFYVTKIMPQMHAYAETMKSGSKSLMDIAAEHFPRTQGTVAEKSPVAVVANKAAPGA